MSNIRPDTRGRRARRVAVTAAVVLAVACGGVADERPELPANARTPLQTLVDDSLDEFTLFGGPSLREPLEIGGRLRWDNNARGSESGLTVVYVCQGRAEAVLCVYPWAERLVHDFGSLSRGRVQGRHEGVTFWQTDEPGTVFHEIPQANPPAAGEAARLLQMRELARRRFAATLVGWRRDDADRQELRLLTRPLYRYERPEGSVFDGAVFAFVMGVDPEVILLIEAVRTDSGERWEYGFVRRTSGELQARLDGVAVWAADRYPPTHDPRGLLRGVTRPLPPDVLGNE